jgi:hypothetical protein
VIMCRIRTAARLVYVNASSAWTPLGREVHTVDSLGFMHEYFLPFVAPAIVSLTHGLLFRTHFRMQQWKF